MVFPAPANRSFTLERVREQFGHWRRTREKKGAIPEALWEAAVLLHSDYSLCQIAKVLRLSYNDLKRRVQTQKSNITSHSNASFIELGLSDPIYSAECVVEMKDQKGASMRMYFKGKAGVDLLELGKTFWNKRP